MLGGAAHPATALIVNWADAGYPLTLMNDTDIITDEEIACWKEFEAETLPSGPCKRILERIYRQSKGLWNRFGADWDLDLQLSRI